MKVVNIIAGALIVVGGLNWGLVGVANFDLVATVFGEMSLASRAVYGLVGLSALFLAITWRPERRPSFARVDA